MPLVRSAKTSPLSDDFVGVLDDKQQGEVDEGTLLDLIEIRKHFSFVAADAVVRETKDADQVGVRSKQYHLCNPEHLTSHTQRKRDRKRSPATAPTADTCGIEELTECERNHASERRPEGLHVK